MAVPSDYAGLELWLKGDAGVFTDDAASTPATNNGDVIAVWQDQSGNARHATQTVNGNRPTLDVTVGLGGKNVIDFASASSHFLNLPNFLTGFTAAEVWIVMKPAADPPASSAAGIWKFGSDTTNADFYTWTDGSAYIGFGTTVRKSAGNPAISIAAWHVLRVLSAASDYKVWTTPDDVLLFSTATNTVGWTTTPTLGRSTGSSVNYHLNGKIAEIFIYSQARSTAERAALMAYIAGRYFASTQKARETNQVWERIASFSPNAEVTSDILAVVQTRNVNAEVTHQSLAIVRQKVRAAMARAFILE